MTSETAEFKPDHEDGAAGPAIILVRPQLAENIGMAARAMGNFGLSDLRLVAPRDGWPQKSKLKKGAVQAASGASDILKAARLFDTVGAAIADLHFVYATTARVREMVKPVTGPEAAMSAAATRIAAGQGVGVLFGPERTGLDNDEVALADAILTFPVNPRFSSLNLAQAVLLVGYEWLRQAAAPVSAPDDLPAPAKRETLLAFFAYVERELDATGYLDQAEKRPIILRNLFNIFHRMAMSEQDVKSLRGAFRALVRARGSTPPADDDDR